MVSSSDFPAWRSAIGMMCRMKHHIDYMIVDGGKKTAVYKKKGKTLKFNFSQFLSLFFPLTEILYGTTYVETLAPFIINSTAVTV